MLSESKASPTKFRNQFHIGGVSVHIVSERSEDVVFGASLHPFQTLSDKSDVEIHVEWVPRIQDAKSGELFDSGSVWQLSECRGRFKFDFSAPSLGRSPYKRFLIDKKFRCGTLQMSEEAFGERRADPLDYPFDELLIMHRLTQEKAIELHGTGIVRPNGDANLFVGHSGAGKSTTTRLWTEREDVEVLSDDRIIVRRDKHVSVQKTPGEVPDSARQYGVLRLRDCSASRTNLSAQDDKASEVSGGSKYAMRMYGTPWHGEAMYASPNSAPLTRIFVLEHGHGNVITPLTPSAAVAELFARSFVPFHRHEYVESALTFLEDVVNSVPVYRFAFEPDERAVDKIVHFHD